MRALFVDTSSVDKGCCESNYLVLVLLVVVVVFCVLLLPLR
jgi:hypothetical protein